MKTYSKVYFSLCLFLAISWRLRTQRKLNPQEQFLIYSSDTIGYTCICCVCYRSLVYLYVLHLMILNVSLHFVGLLCGVSCEENQKAFYVKTGTKNDVGVTICYEGEMYVNTQLIFFYQDVKQNEIFVNDGISLSILHLKFVK